MYLDNFASKFADVGFVVTVFDHRYFGASEGEPRSQLFYCQQYEDYRNAITLTRRSIQTASAFRARATAAVTSW